MNNKIIDCLDKSWTHEVLNSSTIKFTLKLYFPEQSTEKIVEKMFSIGFGVKPIYTKDRSNIIFVRKQDVIQWFKKYLLLQTDSYLIHKLIHRLQLLHVTRNYLRSDVLHIFIPLINSNRAKYKSILSIIPKHNQSFKAKELLDKVLNHLHICDVVQSIDQPDTAQRGLFDCMKNEYKREYVSRGEIEPMITPYIFNKLIKTRQVRTKLGKHRVEYMTYDGLPAYQNITTVLYNLSDIIRELNKHIIRRL